MKQVNNKKIKQYEYLKSLKILTYDNDEKILIKKRKQYNLEEIYKYLDDHNITNYLKPFKITSKELYFNYYSDDPEQYMILTEQLEQEHELELATINSWEKELEVSKNNLETQLNEITTFENTWTKLLQTNVKNDFSYGGVQQ